jgi:DNA-binding NarL/FixJ family response regulator
VVHQGQFWVNSEQIGYVVEAVRSTFSLPVVKAEGVGLLTAREEQVVNLAVEGINNRKIAAARRQREYGQKGTAADL